MTNDPTLVDQIVRAVMSRLATPDGAEGQSAPAKTDCGCGGSKESRKDLTADAAPHAGDCGCKAAADAGDVLRLSARVISLGQLEGRLDGVRRAFVSQRAVVTPAARDLLREMGVAIVSGAEDQDGPPAHPAVVLGVATDKAADDLGVWGHLRAAGIDVQQLARTGLASVVSEMCDAIARDGRLGVLVADRGDVALCLANRRRGVRAIEASDIETIEQSVSTLGANLLVIAAGGSRSEFEVRRLVEQFCQSGPRRIAPQWRDALT